MDYPAESFFASLEIGHLVFFTHDGIINEKAHPHVIIFKDSSKNYILTMCTSQVEKRKNYFEKLHKNFETLVIIDPDNENGLKKETAIDCNTCFNLHEGFLREKHENNELERWGIIKESDFKQIINGLLVSDEIEEDVKDLIRHLKA